MFYEFNHLGSPDYLKVESGKDFNFPPHLHQCFEIIIILSGQMEICVDNKEFRLNKKEALLIFPNQIHSLKSTESEHILCIFSPRLVQAYTTGVSTKMPEDNKFVPDEYLVESMKELTLDSTTAQKKGVLYSLCSQFDKTAVYNKKQKDNDKLLFKIFSFVEEEFKGECSLNKLSESIGYDYSYLSRFFKKSVGISFNSYVNYYRLSHACYLMENSDLPILQCALDSGYISLRSFNRNFISHFNITPTQYRKGISK